MKNPIHPEAIQSPNSGTALRYELSATAQLQEVTLRQKPLSWAPGVAGAAKEVRTHIARAVWGAVAGECPEV